MREGIVVNAKRARVELRAQQRASLDEELGDRTRKATHVPIE